MMPNSPENLSNKLWCKTHEENPSNRKSHTWAKNFAFLFLAVPGRKRATCGPKNVKFE